MLTPFETPGHALTKIAERMGDVEALVFPSSNTRLTFADWDRKATVLARAFLDLGLRPRDHLAVLAETRAEWPILQIAAVRAGLVLVPLNTHYRRDDLAYALEHSEAKGLILSRRFRSNEYLANVETLRRNLPKLEHVIALVQSEGYPSYDDLMERGRRVSIPLPTVKATDVAAILYTSGTTGFPKGAQLTHLGMLANAFGTAQRLGLQKGDRWTSIIPLFHCAGCIMNLLGTLQYGACYVGVPAFDPVEMFRVIESERCTFLSGVPTSYLAMLTHPQRAEFDLSTLRAGTCGGADVDPVVLQRCVDEFPMPGLIQVYGQTEASTVITAPYASDPDRIETSGFPLPGCEVRITDVVSGATLDNEQVGQIEARGPMVMRGYFRMPDASREALTEEHWLKTGDVGFVRRDGKLIIAGGRLKDMIIRGGENIYPVEIEQLLSTHPAVVQSAVFGVADTYYGEKVAAAIRLSGSATAKQLTAFCSDRIARFKIPAIYYRVDSFPLNASGKIRKIDLRDMAAKGTLEILE
jgi:acyl-CoA synthetase (AMP-forming)/AMP-acid ligase II